MSQPQVSSMLPIVSLLEGGLGNKLSIYANLLSWSLENKIPFLYPAFAPYAGYFEGTFAMPLGHITPDEAQRSVGFDKLHNLCRNFLTGFVQEPPASLHLI